MADFTVAEFLEFVRSKPADEEDRYSDVDNCACAQFARHVGVDLNGLERLRMERSFALIILDTPYYDGSRKFGDLAERLAREVRETPAKPSVWLSPQTYVDTDCGEYVA